MCNEMPPATSEAASPNLQADHSKTPALVSIVIHSSSTLTLDNLGETRSATPQSERETTFNAFATDSDREKTPLFVRLGGFEVVDALVGEFYDKVIQDLRVRHIFGGLDVRKLAQHQTRFLTLAFGGNVGITPLDIREVHEHLGLQDEHFDAVLDNLVLTMTEFGFSEDLRNEVIQILETQRPDVLNLPYSYGATGEKQDLGCTSSCPIL